VRVRGALAPASPLEGWRGLPGRTRSWPFKHGERAKSGREDVQSRTAERQPRGRKRTPNGS
jgi:hypothetical protein